MTKQLLKIDEVINKTKICRAKIYQLMELNEFPKSVKLGQRSVAWVESEVDAWIEKRIQERDENNFAA